MTDQHCAPDDGDQPDRNDADGDLRRDGGDPDGNSADSRGASDGNAVADPCLGYMSNSTMRAHESSQWPHKCPGCMKETEGWAINNFSASRSTTRRLLSTSPGRQQKRKVAAVALHDEQVDKMARRAVAHNGMEMHTLPLHLPDIIMTSVQIPPFICL